MYLAKISSQHQITIPVEIMRRLGLSQADRLMISLEQGKIILQPQKKSVADELAGSLDHLIAENKKGKNLKEIMRKTKIATAKKLVQESSPED
jgi:AbrB family looped-hinge helix DNA binding protein